MGGFPLSAREYIQWVFSPHIGVLCDEDVQTSCLKSHLKFVDLLQPFCQLQDDVGISDPNGSLVTVHGLRIVLQDVLIKPPTPAVAKKILSHVVSANVPSLNKELEDYSAPWYEKWRETFHQLLHPFDHEFTKHLIACIIVVSSSHGDKAGQEAQRLSHLQHQQQHQPSQNNATKYPKWFSPNILKYFLVLHDASITPKEVGDAAYQSVNSSCGSCHILTVNSGRPAGTRPLPQYWQPHNLLHASLPGYNSNSVGGSDCSSSPASPSEEYSAATPGTSSFSPATSPPPFADGDRGTPSPPPAPSQSLPTSDHPLSPSLPSMEDGIFGSAENEIVVNVGDIFSGVTNATVAGGEWGSALSVGDVDNIRQFVGSFVRGALVPHVERQVRHLTEVVTNRSRSKSLLSATRRWLGGSKSPGPGSSNTVLYSSEATELQTRRLADLAFMFAMYDVAYTNYHTAKNDFKSDQAWLYFAGAQEMAAFALFMQNGGDFHKRYLDSTWETLSTVCKATNLGIRLLLIACEVLKSKGNYTEAPLYFIKLTSEDSDLLSGLMLEQAASCFMKAGQMSGPAQKRKFAFHMTLAAHRYSKAGQKQLSLRANKLASKIYGSGGLVLAEDHILYSIGKFSGLLKQFGAALEAYMHLVDARNRVMAPSQQTASQQAVYLREFLALYKLVEDARTTSTLSANDVENIEDAVPQLPQLPVPWVLAQQAMLLLDTSHSAERSEKNSNNSEVLASGITFTNCLPEHRDTWAGLERLAVEKVFESSSKPVPPQLLTADTNNTTSPRLPFGEPCLFKLPISNPLLVSFTVREPKLVYKFIPENSDTASEDINNAASIIITVDNDCLVLAPKEVKDIVFKVNSSMLGQLIIEEVELKLNLTPESSTDTQSQTISMPVITGSQSIQVKGPRLNNNLKNRSSVTYAPDKRLEWSIVPPLPRVRVTFSPFPDKLMCGQMTKVDVTITNSGTVPVTGLVIANADPKHSFFLRESQTNPIDRSFECIHCRKSNNNGAAKSNENGTSKPSGFGQPAACCQFSYVQRLPDTSLAVGASIRGSLWLRAQQQPGTQHLLLLFYCHAPDQRQKFRYRLLRHQSTIAVSASAGLRATATSSVSAPRGVYPVEHPTASPVRRGNPTTFTISSSLAENNTANIVLDVSMAGPANNANPAHKSLSILGISGHSSHWKLRPYSQNRKTKVFVLNPGESIRTSVQCYSAAVKSNESASDSHASCSCERDMFSCINFDDVNGGDVNGGEPAITTVGSVSQEFSLRGRVSLPQLSAEAPIPSPVADVSAAAPHPALLQYNSIKNASALDFVLTVQWLMTLHTGELCYGQHCVLIEKIGDTINVPVCETVASVPTEEMKPPVRIIPLEAPILPQIPAKFGASVGLDLSTGTVSGLPSTGLSVSQALALVKGGEMEVTDDLTAVQLQNCVKVTAVVPATLQHDFTACRLCQVRVSVLLHNCTDAAITAILSLNASSDDSSGSSSAKSSTGYGAHDNSAGTNVCSSVRWVGCVRRRVPLMAHSQACLSCVAVVTAAGTFSLGEVSLCLTTDQGVKCNLRHYMPETVTVADISTPPSSRQY